MRAFYRYIRAMRMDIHIWKSYDRLYSAGILKLKEYSSFHVNYY